MERNLAKSHVRKRVSPLNWFFFRFRCRREAMVPSSPGMDPVRTDRCEAFLEHTCKHWTTKKSNSDSRGLALISLGEDTTVYDKHNVHDESRSRSPPFMQTKQKPSNLSTQSPGRRKKTFSAALDSGRHRAIYICIVCATTTCLN